MSRRIVGTAAATSLLAGVLVAVAVWWVVEKQVDELVDHSLQESAEIIHDVLVAQSALEYKGQSTPNDREYESDLVWQVVDQATASVLNRSHRAPAQAMRLTPAPPRSVVMQDGWRIATLGFKHEPQRFLLVAHSEKVRSDARLKALLSALGSALMMVLTTSLLLQWGLRRELAVIKKLSRAVQDYDPMQPSTIPDMAARSELVPVQEAVRGLGQRLAQRIVSERAATTHAAHALRTPLAAIEVQLSAAMAEVPPPVRPRIDRARLATRKLGRVMQALLMMFRSGIEPQRQPLTLGDLLQPALFSDLALDVQGDAPLYADPDLMTAVLLNLMDNAQRHGARHMRLSVKVERSGVRSLSLRDDGQGCPPDQLEQLRSALARQDYSGSAGLKGLGLVLADLVLRAHGGRVELPAVEAGFCVLLWWPATPAQTAPS